MFYDLISELITSSAHYARSKYGAHKNLMFGSSTNMRFFFLPPALQACAFVSGFASLRLRCNHGHKGRDRSPPPPPQRSGPQLTIMGKAFKRFELDGWLHVIGVPPCQPAASRRESLPKPHALRCYCDLKPQRHCRLNAHFQSHPIGRASVTSASQVQVVVPAWTIECSFPIASDF